MSISVLFVCLGNICRSPAAHGIARVIGASLGRDFHFDSCGTGAYHLGSAPDRRMQGLCAQRQTPIGDLRARQLQISDYNDFDWIVAMDVHNYRDIMARRPISSTVQIVQMIDYAQGSTYSEIPDPYYGDLEDFKIVHDLLSQSLQRFLQQV